jgi:PTS system nitrogen regulatory IIA component
MQLTTRDVMKYFGVSESTIQRWVKSRGMPVERVNGQYRFSRAELLEWATANRIQVSAQLFADLAEEAEPAPALAAALQAGGIYYKLSDSNKETALRAIVNAVPLPENFDRGSLLQYLLARESLASTGIGDGIAIPHVRSPIILPTPRPMVALCFLQRPVDFGALDKKPVGILFLLICPNVRAHLQLLSRLASALHDPGFKQAVVQQAPRDAILREARRVEMGFSSTMPSNTVAAG